MGYGLISEKQHFMARLEIKKVLTYKPMGLYSNITPIFDNTPMGFLARQYGKFTLYLSYDLTHLDELDSNILKMYDVQRVWHNANKV